MAHQGKKIYPYSHAGAEESRIDRKLLPTPMYSSRRADTTAGDTGRAASGKLMEVVVFSSLVRLDVFLPWQPWLHQ